uniref:cyclin-dependent kinase inhibitor 3 family protein n=1 Tax=Thaumasiovibrio occultus TaxID=1891184 RepID=UPI000B34F8DA|nr:cyclin-dependent kinase inhibitor 3 family protein [Thaumasiovibrio occultus]
MTHPTWTLPVNDNGAALVLTPCPGTKDVELAAAIAQLKEAGVTAVLTALSEHEMAEAGVAALPATVEANGLAWVHLPIEDDHAPDSQFAQKWDAVRAELIGRVNNGEVLAVHCMGGSGRTGLIAAHLLLDLGWDLADIKQQVQALRPGAFTKQVQIDYIDTVAAQR